MIRVLLLNLLQRDRYRVQRDLYFPFIQGMLRSRGYAVRRVFLAVDPPECGCQSHFVFDLPRDDLNRLKKLLRAWAPTHVLLNERLDDRVFLQLRKAAPDTLFRHLTATVSEPVWAGLTEMTRGEPNPIEPASALLEQVVDPDCGGEALNDLALQVRPFLPLLVGRTCSYRPRISTNPLYAALRNMGTTAGARGCAFCGAWQEGDCSIPGDVVPLAMGQIEASIRTLNPAIQDREFLVRGTNLMGQLDRLAVLLEARGTPPCVFHVSSRIDELVRHEDRIRAALKRMEGLGHRIDLWNMGIENLSPSENQRFNKGLSPETIRRGVLLVRDLIRQHPGGFRFSSFGFILFTPWTTLDDLRINARVSRELDLPELMNHLWTALQLLPDRPITYLARADGLVAETFDDLSSDSGCIVSWEQEEIPWRFRHPEVGRVFSICRRLVRKGTVPEDDPLLPVVSGWYSRASKLPACCNDPLAVFDSAIQAADRADRGESISTTLDRMWEILVAREADAPGTDPLFDRADHVPEALRWNSAPNPWVRMAQAVGQRLGGQRSPLHKLGIQLEGAQPELEEDRPLLRVTLSRGSDPLVMVVEPGVAGRPYFATEGLLGLYFLNRSIPLSPEEAAAMQAILKVAGQCADG